MTSQEVRPGSTILSVFCTSAGDFVWAWDEETGAVALKPVIETYVNESDELVHVFVAGEEIVSMPTHPFYSPGKGWTISMLTDIIRIM